MTDKSGLNIFEKSLKKLSDKVYRHMENGSGHMILLTSMSAILLSMIAQTGAILTNKNYSLSQKAFMVPQELTEGCITALSMFVITKPLQKMSDIYVKRGKILTKDMKNYLQKHNVLDKRGKSEFNLENTINNFIKKLETSEKHTNSDIKLLNEHNNMLQTYNSVYDTSSAISTTAGGVISTAFISPLIRNYTASNFQDKNIKMYQQHTNIKNHAVNIKPYPKI